jgi:hypothetical protein
MPSWYNIHPRSLTLPQLEFRAVSTAEGDIRVLAIRTLLASFRRQMLMAV